jgi:hypothetical protein
LHQTPAYRIAIRTAACLLAQGTRCASRLSWAKRACPNHSHALVLPALTLHCGAVLLQIDVLLVGVGKTLDRRLDLKLVASFAQKGIRVSTTARFAYARDCLSQRCVVGGRCNRNSAVPARAEQV